MRFILSRIVLLPVAVALVALGLYASMKIATFRAGLHVAEAGAYQCGAPVNEVRGVRPESNPNQLLFVNCGGFLP